MDVLRISTAGSVDDGKSTLIGRLLYETKSIPSDKYAAIEEASQKRGLGFTDLSLLTDGLIAEREQGITIDVAHIYFSTPTRRYIIADSPGHEEYTRNMITGNSNSDVAIILVDASRELTTQSLRHLFIANLLKTPQVIVAVNKMDLVDFSQGRFDALQEQVNEYWKSLESQVDIQFLPLSSLFGDNITTKSEKTAWYEGESLLSILETIEINNKADSSTRFQVQLALRSQNNLNRCFTGKLRSGILHNGDHVKIVPGNRTSRIQSISRYKEDLSVAKKGESVTITLEDDIDISRGAHIIPTSDSSVPIKAFEANLCWLDDSALNQASVFTLQQGTAKVKAKIRSVEHVVQPENPQLLETGVAIGLNTIFKAKIAVSEPLLLDPFDENKSNGAFILIDPQTKSTLAIGFRD